MEENENFIHNKYGYCFYSIETNNITMIYNLYIEPGYRKKGHAKNLILMVIKEIRKLGHKNVIQIEAQPKEDNIDIEKLVGFYKRMGLVII